MNILVVLAHPRRESLTGRICDAFVEGAESAGHKVELADLYEEKFDPVLHEQDEPDWHDSARVFSAVVQEEMARIERNEATVMVFPVWWWSMPAILKGWMDRVWNHGFAYTFAEGAKTYPHEHALMIGLAGVDRESYEKRAYDNAIRIQLDTGILDYCEIRNHGLAFFYDMLSEDPAMLEQYLEQAAAMGARFPDFSNLPGQ